MQIDNVEYITVTEIDRGKGEMTLFIKIKNIVSYRLKYRLHNRYKEL